VIIDLMGDKATARKTVSAANVPITPGTDILPTVEEGLAAAEKVGYPVMIKATAGGGGKGMRIAWDAEEFKKNYVVASTEAAKAFNNGAVFLEKFIEEPRHIEIQVLADERGKLHPSWRARLFHPAPAPEADRGEPFADHDPGAAREDGDGGCERGQSRRVYRCRDDRVSGGQAPQLLLHGNEHPYPGGTPGDRDGDRHRSGQGADPVAAGEKLSHEQRDVVMSGHAIECRINAENPYMNFIPSPGKITGLHIPGGLGVRVETHIYEGYEIRRFTIR
jgi:acetyl-CoA carboxylase biotin carboxylase subunit